MIYNTTSYGGWFVCVWMVHVCVFGKLRTFLCRMSNSFSQVKKNSSGMAHLLRPIGESGDRQKRSYLLPLSTHSHISNFELLTNYSLFLSSNPQIKWLHIPSPRLVTLAAKKSEEGVADDFTFLLDLYRGSLSYMSHMPENMPAPKSDQGL